MHLAPLGLAAGVAAPAGIAIGEAGARRAAMPPMGPMCTEVAIGEASCMSPHSYCKGGPHNNAPRSLAQSLGPSRLSVKSPTDPKSITFSCTQSP